MFAFGFVDPILFYIRVLAFLYFYFLISICYQFIYVQNGCGPIVLERWNDICIQYPQAVLCIFDAGVKSKNCGQQLTFKGGIHLDMNGLVHSGFKPSIATLLHQDTMHTNYTNDPFRSHTFQHSSLEGQV